MKNANDKFPKFIYQFPEVMLPPGVDGNSNFLDAQDGQVVFHTIPEGQRIPLHCHGDSWAILISGVLEIVLGKKIFTAQRGASWFIPSGVMHSGNALKESLLIEVFSERRFLSKNNEPDG